MQKLIVILLFAWAAVPALRAQNIVQETEKTMALGSRPCFRLDFAKTDEGLVEKLWKSFVKDQFDAKLKKDKKAAESAALGIESGIISSDKFDLYSRTESYGTDGVTLLVWFDVGSYFLNRRDNPSRTGDAVDVLKRFYYTVRREVVSRELEDQQDKLKDLEKKLKNLQKDKSDLQKDIEDYKAKIRKAEEDIVKNEQMQTQSQSDIEAQKRTVEEVRVKLSNIEKEN